MTEQERLNAGKAQTSIYLTSQFSKWRLFSILTAEKIINEFTIFEELIDNNLCLHSSTDYFPQRQYYAGVVVQALAEAIQNIEDLFALIYCAQDIPMFVGRIANYKAGKISNFVKTAKIDRSNFQEMFFFRFPLDGASYPDAEIHHNISARIDRTISDLSRLQDFYTRFEYLYLQYKHGLSLVFQSDGLENRPISREEFKAGIQVWPFDNLEITKAIKEKRTQLGISMFLSEWTQRHVVELDRQNNLLRFIIGIEDLKIESIVQVARITTNLNDALRQNMLDFCTIPERHPVKCYLPGDNYEAFSTLTEGGTT
jgi:hypothetical protein